MFQFKAWRIQWFWEGLSFSWIWLLISYLCFLHWLRWLSVNKAGDDEQEKSWDWHHGQHRPSFHYRTGWLGYLFYNSASAPFEEHKNTCGLPGLCWFIHTPVLLFKMPAHQPNKIQVSCVLFWPTGAAGQLGIEGRAGSARTEQISSKPKIENQPLWT